jgi:hypothetical protein
MVLEIGPNAAGWRRPQKAGCALAGLFSSSHLLLFEPYFPVLPGPLRILGILEKRFAAC